MNKLYKYPLIILLALLASCDSLLDINADNMISGNVLTDTESIQSALNGAYFNFSGYSNGVEGGELMGGDFIMIPELLSRISGTPSEFRWEIVLTPTDYRDFINKDILETNTRVQANWVRAYETINQVNNIIANIDNVDDAAAKSRIHGEALAMRGILYYEMALLWAPQYDADGVTPATQPAVPIRTEAVMDVNDIPKLSAADVASLEEVYNQAFDDLTAASVLLKSARTNGTSLNYYACQAYLAKLSLQRGDYAEAEAYASEVISGPYKLTSDPLKAFNNTSNSTEDIFAIQQSLANNVGDRSTGLGLIAYFSSLEESGLGVYGFFSNVLTSDSWLNSPLFADSDIRGSIDLDVDSTTVNTELTTAYYQNLANNDASLLSTTKFSSAEYVLPIIRLAEMYLIRCEANFSRLNGVTAQAIDDLNEIRTRAGIAAVSTSDFADADQLFDSLVVERNREFMHEGMLLEDLKRWGGYAGRTNGLKYDTWGDEFVLPIPRSEKDTWTD